MNTEKSLLKRTWAMLIMPPIMLLLVSIIFSVIFFIYTSGDGSAIPNYFQSYMPLILMVNHLALFFILRSFLRKDNLTLKNIGWFIDRKNLLVDILVGIATAIVLYFYNELIVEPIQANNRGDSPDFSIGISIKDQINWALLASAVTLPVIEELIYRGYAYEGFKNKYKVGFTIITSSVLFGALHWGLGLLTAVLIIPFGILFFVVFLSRKRNLVAVIVGHCLYNSMVLILT